MKYSIYCPSEKVLTKGVPIRELTQTIGVIVSSFMAVLYGQLWYRELKTVGFSFKTEQVTTLAERLTSLKQLLVSYDDGRII